MNQTFNFKRWSLLVAKHWAENKKRYLLSVGAIASLLFLWFVFILFTDPYDPLAKGLQDITYYVGLFLAGPFYASQYFRDLHARPKGIAYLMTPASTFEKLLTTLFYGVFLFFAVYTLTFYIVDILTISFANTVHPSYTGRTLQNWGPDHASISNVFRVKEEGRDEPGPYFILIFLAVQSVSILGSVYFPKYSYIKTAITLFLLFLFVFFLESYFERTLLRGNFENSMTSYRVHNADPHVLVQLPEWIGKVLFFLLMFGFPLLFWIVTYYRLKEKEV